MRRAAEFCLCLGTKLSLSAAGWGGVGGIRRGRQTEGDGEVNKDGATEHQLRALVLSFSYLVD